METVPMATKQMKIIGDSQSGGNSDERRMVMMEQHPVVSKWFGFRQVLLGCAVLLFLVSAQFALAEEPKLETSEQILKQLNEVAAQPFSEAQEAEIDRLVDLLEKAIAREEAAAAKAGGDVAEGKDTVKPKSEATPEPTPKPKARPKRTPKPKATPAPKSNKGRDKASGKSDKAEKPAPSKRGKSTSTRDKTPPRSRRGKPAPSRVDSVSVQPEINIDAENYLKPFFQRQYSFSIKEGTYVELIESFARMSGLGVIGEAPDGPVSFVSDETMDFRAALGRVQMLLFNHVDKYWIFLRDNKYLQIARVTEITRIIPPERIYPTLAEYQAADLDENELALLLYTPEEGSIADLEPIRDFMPDYVRIAPLSDTENAMTVFGLVKDINKYLVLIEKFQIRGDDPRRLKIINIEHVLPTEAVEALSQLVPGFSDSGASSARGRKSGATSAAAVQAHGVTAIPDDVRKTLLIQAVPKKIEEIEKFLAYIDIPMPDAGYTPVVVRVEHADAGELLELVSSLMGASDGGTADGAKPVKKKTSRKRRGKTADTPAAAEDDDLTMFEWPPANAIILIGREEEVAKASELIARFDVPAEQTTKIVEVKNGDPHELIDLTMELLEATDKGVTESLVCTVDPTGKGILLAGPLNAISQAEMVIAKLDIKRPEKKIHSVQLKYAKPSVVMGILGTLETSGDAPSKGRKKGKRAATTTATPRVTFQAEDDNSILYVICTDEDWENKYLPDIQKLDNDLASTDEYVVIPVEFVDPADLFKDLTNIFTGKGRKKATTPNFTIVPGGILVMNADPGELESIKGIIAEIDVDPAVSGAETRRTFVLKHAEPGEIIAVIEALVGDAESRKKKPGTSNIRFVEQGDKVWVTAPAKKMEEIAALIEELDVADTEREIRSYEFPIGTNIIEFSNTLKDFFPEQAKVTAKSKARRGKASKPRAGIGISGDEILFVPQPSARKLFVSAPVEQFPKIEQTIELLRPDTKERPGMVVEFFNVEKTEPSMIFGFVESIIEQRLEEMIANGEIPEPEDKKQSPMLISPDDAGGRIIYFGPSLLVDEIKTLIADLEKGGFDRVNEKIALKNATADEMVVTLNAMISGKSAPPAAKPSGKRRSKGRSTAKGGTATTPSGVTVVAAPGNEAVIVSGPRSEVEEVKSWIAMLDADATRETVMKVFHLKVGDVSELAPDIMAIFDTGASGKKRGRGGKDAAIEDEYYTGGPLTGQEIRLTANTISNEMIVWAAPRKLAEIEDYIDLYEKEIIDTTDPKILPKMTYDLEYADAFDASYELQDFISALWDKDEPEVDYIPFTNTLVIESKNPDKDFPEIKQLIAKYVDKEGEGGGISINRQQIKGASADKVAALLAQQLERRGVKVTVEGVGEKSRTSRLKELTPDDVDHCVLPSVMVRALDAIGAGLTLQEAPAEKAEKAEKADEPVKEEPPKEEPVKEETVKKDSAFDGSRAAILERMLRKKDADENKKGSEVRIVVDHRTNTISFEGPGQAVADAKIALEELMEEMEDTSSLPDIRIWELKHVDPTVAAQVLETMFNASGAGSRNTAASRRAAAAAAAAAKAKAAADQAKNAQGQEEEDAKGGKKRGGKDEKQPAPAPAAAASSIKVLPYPALNAIIIKASTEMFPAIEELVATIDRPTDPTTDFRFFKIKNQLASDVETQLNTIFGLDQQARTPTASRTGRNRNNQAQAQAMAEMMRQQINLAIPGEEGASLSATESIKVTSNNITNTVMVLAPKRVLDLTEKIIAKIEEQVPAPRIIKSIPLKYADAAELVPQLESLLAGGGSSGRSGRRGGSSQGISTFRPDDVQAKLIADTANNAVVVRAEEEDIAKVEEIIAQLDVKGPSTPELFSFDIKNGEAAKIAKTLTAIFNVDVRGRGGKSSSQLKFVGDADSNTVFVSAPKEKYEEIKKRVETLDSKNSAVDIKTFKLKHARAPEVLKQLKSMVGDLMRQLKGQSGQMGPYSASADERSNSLTVMGEPETFAFVERILEEVDVPEAQPIAVTTLVVALNKARANEVANSIRQLFKGRGDGIEPPQAVANNSTNTLLIRGTHTQIEEIQNSIIKPLDEFAEAPDKMLKEMVVPLKFIQADEAAEYLKSWFTDRKRAFDALQLKGVQPAEFTVAITPEPGSNQLVVLATEENQARIKARIADIDKEGAGTLKARITKVYAIKYCDPNGVNNVIRNAFKPGRRTAEKDRVDSAVEWATQSLIVTASEANQDAIDALIKELDKESGRQKARFIYEMKNARASKVADMVNRTIGQSRKRNRTGEMPVSVVADDELNVLIVSATQKEYEDVLPLIEQLDKKPLEGGLEIRVYPLKFADPGSMIGAINNSFPRLRGSRPEDMVKSSYTWGTSSLIVSASPANHEKVAKLIKEVDVESSVDRQTHVIQLKEANAEEMARRLNDIMRRTQRRRRDDQGMAIVADPGTNSLLVFANESELASVQELVKTLDVIPSNLKGRETEIYPINYCDPNGVYNVIRTAYQGNRRMAEKDRVDCSVEWATQSIVVTASPENQKEIAELIKELDKDSGRQKNRNIYEMKNARASKVADMVNRTLGQTRKRSRTGQMPVSVVADDELNVLIVTATDKEYEEVLPLIERLDKEPLEGGLEIKVYPIKFADPGSMINAINSSFPRLRGSNPEDIVKASYTWGTSSLIVSASAENHKKVEKLIAEVDVESSVDRTTRVIVLKEGNAEDLARRLSDIVRRTQRRRRDDQGMAIVADPGTNSLLVFANDAEFARVEELVKTLDVAPTFDKEVRSFRLTFADVHSTSQAITQLFGQSRSGRRASPQDQVAVVAEWASNSVVVSAAPAKMKEIEAFIKDIDQSVAGGREVHVVKIKNADPESVVRSLNDIFVRSSHGRRGQQTISISATRGSDSILIKANEKEFEEINAVIAQLDVLPNEGQRDVKMFTLKYTDATEMQTIIEDYLQKPGTNRGRRGSQDLMGNIRLSTLPTTNSLVATGAKESLERVAQLVAEIDVEVEDAGNAPKIIKLEKSLASEIEPTLTKMFVEGASKNRGRGRGSSTSAITPVIIANDTSNSLIVRASPSDFSLIEKLAMSLDEEEKDPLSRVKLIPVANLYRAEDLAVTVEETLRNSVQKSTGSTRRNGRTSTEISVEAIPTSNSLLVSGDPKLLEVAEALVAQIVAMGPPGGRGTVILEPNNMSAEEIKSVIQEMLDKNKSQSSSRGRSRGRRR